MKIEDFNKALNLAQKIQVAGNISEILKKRKQELDYCNEHEGEPSEEQRAFMQWKIAIQNEKGENVVTIYDISIVNNFANGIIETCDKQVEEYTKALEEI